jgi:lipopolysaccharide transport system ATP-binding protein
MDSVVVAEKITKTYRVGVGRARVREMTPPPFDRALSKVFPKWWWKGTFNALEDVSMEIAGGSCVGIVGHNGAGKTTLLKVLAEVTAPTSGKAIVRGRVAALVDALVGFHPELTGRENAFLLGSMHGFGRKEMASRIDDIFEFAEIEEMADTPVKRYSSGMSARLGFSVVTALELEILLVDEILAVGDANFQRKCIEWLEGYRRSGGTLLFVSHNLGLVRSMTERLVWLDHGRVVEEGPTDKVLPTYAQAMERRDGGHRVYDRKATKKAMESRGMHRWGSGGARVEEAHVNQLRPDGSAIEVTIDYENDDVASGVFCVGFIDESGREIGAAISQPIPLNQGNGAIRCTVDHMPFRPGIYFPVVAIVSPEGEVRDRWRLDRAVVIERNGHQSVDGFGAIELPSAWSSSESQPQVIGRTR